MKTGSYRKIFSTLAALMLFALSIPAHAAFILSFDSSPNSWVGQGESRFITPDDGYTFNARSNFDNGLSFNISRGAPFGDPLRDWWTLDLAAPFENLLTVGLYENATRWPFQAVDAAGLTFSGNHRGNNRNLGFFEVLEATYDPFGVIESFAVDFTQYDEQNLNKWIVGKLRFNSQIPVNVPEPGTMLLLLVGLFGLTIASIRARRKQRAC